MTPGGDPTPTWWVEGYVSVRNELVEPAVPGACEKQESNDVPFSAIRLRLGVVSRSYYERVVWSYLTLSNTTQMMFGLSIKR
jgi:hypothetical protein